MQERTRILKLVEEGKLTAEEAIILLESLEKDKKEAEQKKEDMITALSTEVLQEEHSKQHHGSTNQKQSTSFKNNILEFVESALQKIKDVDLDFNFGPSTSIQHIFQQSNVYIQDIDVDVANGQVKVVPWDENDVRIECDAKVYHVGNQDEARKSFLQEVLFSIDSGKLRFSVQKKQLKVNATVYVPKTEYHKLTVRMFNGPINGEGLNVEKVKLKSANGSIAFNSLTSKEIEVETANGHINLLDCSTKELEAETINGMIKVTGYTEKLDVQSFNGNIVTELNGNCQSILAKTKTGSIDLFIPTHQSVEAELKSNLGSFTCEVPGMDIVEEKNEVVQKLLRFKAKKEGMGLTYILAESNTGSILIKPNEVK
ncbi:MULTISPECIES: DUF4097 family beta strand repeat-containing protein [Bacillus]|uniref:DUF4097 family beta strand repeat-containing protein n=1 Tax=Bacillus TaxID=1386 RepID=UPI000BB9A33D|nr:MULTISPECIES: DUF4097 domain-containing protein [Bacillus]